MSKNKTDNKNRPVYYISVGSVELIGTYDINKAIELWKLLSDNFFRITNAYDRLFADDIERNEFLFMDKISRDSNVTLRVASLHLYPDKSSSNEAQSVLRKLQETNKNVKLNEVTF